MMHLNDVFSNIERVALGEAQRLLWTRRWQLQSRFQLPLCTKTARPRADFRTRATQKSRRNERSRVGTSALQSLRDWNVRPEQHGVARDRDEVRDQVRD